MQLSSFVTSWSLRVGEAISNHNAQPLTRSSAVLLNGMVVGITEMILLKVDAARRQREFEKLALIADSRHAESALVTKTDPEDPDSTGRQIVDVGQNFTMRCEMQKMGLNVLGGTQSVQAGENGGQARNLGVCRPCCQVHLSVVMDNTVKVSFVEVIELVRSE